MNWLDIAILVALGAGLAKGGLDGFIKQIASLLSLILAIFFAGKTARPLRDFLVSFNSITNVVDPHLITAICYILIFTLIVFVFIKLGNLLSKTMVSTVSCLNHILGGFLGIFLAILLLSLMFNILIAIDSDSRILKEHTKQESIFYDKVEGIVTFISPFIKEAHKNKEEQQEQKEQKEQKEPKEQKKQKKT